MSGSVTVLKNSTVTYTIEKEGYTTVTNTVVVSEDTSTTVTMDLALVTLTIEPDPSDATVTLTAAGYTQSGNSISVAPGTTVNYSVSKEGYTTATGSEVCTINRTINCTIIALQKRTITVNLYSGTLLWVLNGTETAMSYGNTYTAEVLPGASVVFELKFNGTTNVLYVQESSNEACIPNVIFSWDEYRAEFIMPDEDISCIVSSILEPT